MSPPIDVESLLPPVNMYGARLEKLEQCCCSLPSRSVVALNHRIAPCKPQRRSQKRNITLNNGVYFAAEIDAILPCV